MHNEHEVGTEMTNFFAKFFDRYPEFKNRPMYITGESYAGRYIPWIAAYLVKADFDFVNL